MKLKTLTFLAIAAILASCSAKKDNTETAAAPAEEVAAIDITGQWNLDKISADDSTVVIPAEAVPGSNQYVIFTDSSYFISTNCNTISGPLILKGDSITFGDGPMTEMACDNMATEDILRKVLYKITTVKAENDSIVRLNGATPSEYIILRKTTEKK